MGRRRPEAGEEKVMLAFREAFGVPAGHALRQVRPAPGAEAGAGLRQWEHEEYDEGGKLIAVYESWLWDGGGVAFIKYSPHGWVLRRHDGAPQIPKPDRRRVRTAGMA